VPDQALKRALNSFELCFCPQLFDELEAVFSRRRFDRYMSKVARQAFLGVLRQHGQMFSIRPSDLDGVSPPCRDAKDNMLLALASVGQADVIVSSDNDLLVLHPWRGIPILTAAQFLAQFAE
jgi:hypothetical protein